MAQDSLALAKANQETQANKKRRSLTFQVGEKVLLSSAHINLASRNPKATRKLSPRFIGPYPVIQKVSEVAYKLELPASLKIHPVFHVSRLKSYVEPTSYPGRSPVTPPPPPETVEDHEEYEVEQLLDHRNRKGKEEYLVKWVGYPEYDASWEPLANLSHAQESLEEYEQELLQEELRRGDSVMIHTLDL
jgi:hypothetical protein